ncbi:MAG: hypothetical protein CFH04_00876 [Alphaproteobacteria bacterium MarineAlpha3_Bin3]|nr:MAG: hypothetical protein CFH04_00876 [Alphaproteobacteria bacterium MarineAlpha3_Bin3]
MLVLTVPAVARGRPWRGSSKRLKKQEKSFDDTP